MDLNYFLDVLATIVVAFAGGMVLHRILWKFFDWVLDKIESWDEEDR
jgi:hypothetical protein|tara:strand:+ start:1812 stop:1952 length:141 start_codon:yes stop_codon:yes gene_type:complete